MKYKNILFDFGYTLVHLDPHKEDVFLNVLERNKIKKSKEEIIKAFLYCEDIQQSAIDLKSKEYKRKFLIEYNKKILHKLEIDNIDLLAIEIYNEFKKAHWKLFSDTIFVLEKLKEKGFRLAILSNWEIVLHELCRDLNINHFFELILASADVGVEKPDPQFFNIILSKLNMDAEKTLYVGDDYNQDVLSAKNAGIKPILIDRNDFYVDKDCIKIKNLKDIFSVIE